MRQLLTATQINQWFVSTRRHAQELLPHVVRRLINATMAFSALKALRMPVHDAINMPGPDGVVEAEADNPYVPHGLSVWEMGTGEAVVKAEGDYASRTKKPGQINPAETTFVFVTPRAWSGKEQWAQSKKDERRWKSVRVLDAIDLEGWLEVAPGVGRWLAEQMGVPVAGLRDLDLFCKELDHEYHFSIPPELVIGGRKEAVEQLEKWIDSDSGEISVEGESIEEASAFFSAVARLLPDEKRAWVTSRTLFVTDPEAINALSGVAAAQFVVPLTVETQRRAKALRASGLRLVVPSVRRGRRDKGDDGAIRLGSVKRAGCEEVLVRHVKPDQRARRIAQHCKGSLTAILWMVAYGPDTPLPWTEGDAAAELVPLLLAGQWLADSGTDRSIVERLSGRPHEDLVKTIARWRSPAGPLTLRSGLWGWMAADYAWDSLAPVLDGTILERLAAVVREVLGTPDPKFELPPEDRWAAAIYDKKHPASEFLRAGLVASLVQLALRDDMIPGGSQPLIEQAIASLLNGTVLPRPVAWQSLAPWLPDLAEAAPTVFLAATEFVAKDAETVAAIFVDGGLFGTSPHVYLLWALERLAWSEQLFARVVSVLGDLAAVDPGGQLRNRPSTSLTEIFLPWHPQGTATLSQRLDAMDLLGRDHPDVAWRLAVSLLPNKTTLASQIAKPHWRNWRAPARPEVTQGDYVGLMRGICQRMLQWAGNSGARWSDVVDAYAQLRGHDPEVAASVVTALQALQLNDFGSADRETFADRLRELVVRHREFSDAEWAMKANELETFEALHARFAPDNAAERHKWLFNTWPNLPEQRKLKYEELSELIAQRRLDALQDVYGSKGLEGVIEFAQNVASPEAVGFTFSRIEHSLDEGSRLLRRALGVTPTPKEVPPLLRFGVRYVAGKFQAQGFDWVERVRSLPEIARDANSLANLAWGLPEEGPTWDHLDSWGQDAARLYWQRVTIDLVRNQSRDAERAVCRLLDADRPYRAINVAGMSLWSDSRDKAGPSVSKATIVIALSKAPQQELEAEWYPPSIDWVAHHVEELLSVLEKQGLSTEELAAIEWQWLSTLRQSRRGPKALQELLSTNPIWFAQALELVFRAEGEEARETSEEEQARAEQAYRLLESWVTVPGSRDLQPPPESRDGGVAFATGTVNEDALLDWVTQARKLAQERRRLGVCDVRIGELLAHAPIGEDGAWPCEPVRNLLEILRNGKIEQSMNVGIHSRRGAHFRSPGGEQERQLAAQFAGYASRVRSRWPRTATVLDAIAQNFEREARREDEREAFDEFQ